MQAKLDAVLRAKQSRNIDESLYIPSPNKKGTGMTKNFGELTFTVIANKIYYVLRINRIRKIMGKAEITLEKSIHNFSIFDYFSNLRKSTFKKILGYYFYFVEFHPFNSI